MGEDGTARLLDTQLRQAEDDASVQYLRTHQTPRNDDEAQQEPGTAPTAQTATGAPGLFAALGQQAGGADLGTLLQQIKKAAVHGAVQGQRTRSLAKMATVKPLTFGIQTDFEVILERIEINIYIATRFSALYLYSLILH